MYKDLLYPYFYHWLTTDGIHNNSLYFYSDPHFGDLEMCRIRLDNPKATRKDLEAFDMMQVRNINSKVGKNDTIVFLGDIGDAEKYIPMIKGYKVLIMGNHEKGITNYKKKDISLSTSDCGSIGFSVGDGMFDEVIPGILIIGKKIILSHEPLKGYDYACNIHGHKHNLPMVYDQRHLNVCAESINYIPISFKDIVRSGKLKGAVDIHRECVETAKIRTQS